ncbi:MAG: SusC/RagA family TonB-linked outer membrane protein [Bacteroidales bacterium]|nr:SusC/RagA family TonB-linked outer membrane protein [Bacteroidales bacterium]
MKKRKLIKAFLIMKFMSLFMLCFSLQLSAEGFSQHVTLKMKNSPFQKVAKELERQTGYTFLFNVEQVNGIKKNADFSAADLKDVLGSLLQGTGLSYRIVDKTVVIVPAKELQPESQEEKVISGRVQDEAGRPIPGVSILVQGSTKGVLSDMEGNFNLKITRSDSFVLVFSFVGMKTEYKTIKPLEAGGVWTGLKIVMKEEAMEIGDLVVTGYANVKRSSFTGSSVQVKKEDILKVTTRNVIDALQVFDPSLRLMTNNVMGSDPNTLPEFYVRGRSGIGVKELDPQDISQAALQNNPNSPVFIMDGFEVSVEKVYDFDPNRIASLTILKDAAATAIYGSRAANGVIVIETVAPETGKVKVNYNFVATLTAPDISDYNLTNAREKLETEVLSGAFIGTTDADKKTLYEEYMTKLSAINRGVNTDWLAQPIRNELNHKHSLYLEGGSNELRFGVNVKYDAQNGVMKGSSRNRFGVGLDLGYRVKNLKIKNQITFDNMKAIDSPYGSFSEYAKVLPYSAPYDDNGELVQTFPRWHEGQEVNPLYEALKTNSFSENGYTEFTNNLSLDWYILDNLQLKGQFAISKYDSHREKFLDPGSAVYVSDDNILKGELTQNESSKFAWNTNLFLNYLKSIKKHYVNFSLGINAKETKTNDSYARYRGFPSGNLYSPQFASEIVGKPSFSDSHGRLFGSFASLNYTYDDIYLFDASFRVDGSSDFGTEKKYAPFWSTGVGVNIHNYSFMDNKWLSLLKLRTTYGQTGKVNFPAYAAKQSFDILENWYDTGHGVLLTYLGNENLKWERTNIYDIGFELGFLENRYIIKGAVYNKKTVDLITDVTIPASTGFYSYKDNLGEVVNKGIELDMKLDIIKKRDLFVSLYANFAHNNNEILKISESLKAYNDLVDQEFSTPITVKDGKYSKPLMKYTEGGSLTSIWGMKSLGINPTDGKELFLKPDGTITSAWNSSDQVIIGDSEPAAQGAFGLNLQWKNFSLFTSFLYEFGGDEYNQTLVNRVENVDIWKNNVDRRVLMERWRKPGDVTKLKDIAEQDIITRPSSRFIQTYNGVRFNSLTIGYTFDKKLTSRLGMSMLRLQFNMKDVLKITNVRQERGTTYPFARTYNFTLNASF